MDKIYSDELKELNGWNTPIEKNTPLETIKKEIIQLELFSFENS